MRLNKKIVRLALIAAVTAGVCLPYLSQLKNSRAGAETPPAPSPAAPRDDAPIVAFPQVAPDKVVLTIGDQKVTAGEVTALFAQFDRQTQAHIRDTPSAKRDLAEHFIKLKLMAAEAKREKLDESMLFKAEYEQLLGKALIHDIQSDGAANLKYFNENKDWFSGLKARHILIAYVGSPIETAKLTEPQAKAKAEEIRARLGKGEDFAVIARAESDDRGSAATGGDLGLMTRYQMVPAFEEAAYALKDNEVSQPIKTQFGYHIIKVLGRTTAAYEECAQLVPRRRVEALIEGLRKAHAPEVNDAFFGPGEVGKPDAPKTDAPKTGG